MLEIYLPGYLTLTVIVLSGCAESRAVVTVLLVPLGPVTVIL
jgi:hypothetical protein